MDPSTKTDQQDRYHISANPGTANPVALSKYSSRVELKTILERSDGGAGLVGERVVIGGWVKSSKEVKKESPPPAVLLPSGGGDRAPGSSNMTCTEIIQSRISIFKKLFDVLSGGGGRQFPEKTEAAAQKPAQPPSYIFYFLISDGSSVASLQVVVDSALSSLPATQLKTLGTCIVAEGVLRHPTAASGKHAIELKAEKLLHVGTVDSDKYPLSKKQLPLHLLRDYSHFRARTTTVASVTRIQSALTFASHTFFQYHGFQYIQTPIITTTDGEGFSEMFHVTTLLGKTFNKEEPKSVKENDLNVVKAAIREKSNRVEQLKRTESNREAFIAAVQDLKKTNDLAAQLEAKQKSKKAGTLIKPEKLDFSKDFFSHEAYLSVSGRLHLESYACALGNVYSFGPRFRADKIDSARHLAEMWNVEAEMAFSELEGAMNCAHDFFKFLCKYILDRHSGDLKFVSKRVDKTIVDRLEAITSGSIVRLSYTEVLTHLQKATHKAFQTKPEWGVALTTEHLSYLADQIYKGPVIIYNHPKAVKPFYVRLNDDNKTAAAFDLFVPKVGVVISGSQNEERFGKLDSRIKELGLPREQYEWYLDLRRHGTVKHSGLILSMDLMLVFATGLPDVKDVVPFPRSWGKANN